MEEIKYKGLKRLKEHGKQFLYDMKDLKLPLAFAAGGVFADRYTTLLGMEKLREWGINPAENEGNPLNKLLINSFGPEVPMAASGLGVLLGLYLLGKTVFPKGDKKLDVVRNFYYGLGLLIRISCGSSKLRSFSTIDRSFSKVV